MSQERPSFVSRLLSGFSRGEQEEQVLRYIAHRLRSGADLEHTLKEEYVCRNLSKEKIEELIRDPELLRIVREHMERDLGPIEPR